MSSTADVIVIGAGLAGLVAATELTSAGKRVLVLEQEPAQSLGGQSHWSLGGLFFVDSPEQRRMGIRDCRELALADWQGSAGFDRESDSWGRRWSEAYVDFACGEKRDWLHAMGMRWFPVVGWAERGGAVASGHGNSVPRFHITWGTGPGVLEPFLRRAQAALTSGLLRFEFRRQVTELIVADRAVTGVRGAILADDSTARGTPSSRQVVGDFSHSAQAVIIASGGIGGNHELVRRYWPARLGDPPQNMLCGVPQHVDGAMLAIAARAGANLVNTDRMWHYVEGVKNWSPIWPLHANQSIIRRELGLSGSEQNPDITGKRWRDVARRALNKGGPVPVQAFMQHGEDFLVRDNLEALVAAMNGLAGNGLIDYRHLRDQIEARDRQTANPFAKDGQIVAINNALRYRGDRLTRIAKPHRLLDPAHGPLVAVRLHIVTRKSLGGLQTDLDGRVLDMQGQPLDGLYAAGEVAGFGGGGMHGYRALEGTFLGGCLFSGRTAGRSVAAACD
jgi:predicted oxidoreductase